MSATDRLAELGITLPTPAKPAGSYIPAIQVGSLVYSSGQLPFVDGKLLQTGKVGAEVSPEDANKAARQAAINAVAAVAALVGLDHIKRVVKVLGFVASDPSFTAQPTVINGASDVLVEIFGDSGKHARSAVGVAVLPADTPVEVEIIVEVA
ncbi:MAG: RidA family protein [Antricoccus sp.]